MASELDAINSALQKVGSKRVTSINDTNSTALRDILAVKDVVRQAELRAHPWNFSIQRFALPADAEAPAFGFENQFTLPARFLGLMPRDPLENIAELDWQIEGRKLLTNDSAPLNVRAKMDIEDFSLMDALFVEVYATALALAIVERTTQSNTKRDKLTEEYEFQIRRAKRINAIENRAQQPPVDPWVAAHGD